MSRCIAFSFLVFILGNTVARADSLQSGALYQYDPQTDAYVQVSPDQLVKHHVYSLYDQNQMRFYWVTPEDYREILPGSKVQGWRLGYSKTQAKAPGLDWFRLVSDDNTWHPATDRERPIVYRRDESGENIIAERAPNNWENLGGRLDPLPQDAPRCQVAVAPTIVQLGDNLQFHVAMNGRVSEAQINGEPATLNWSEQGMTADYTIHADAPGFYTLEVKIKGPTGQAGCQASYGVQPSTLTTSSR